MLLKYGHSLSPVRNWFIGNGLCSRLAYPTNLASDRTFTHYASSSYYDKLVKDANDLCVGLKYTNVANILTKFISSNHDTAVLKEIYPSSANNLDKVAEIDNCLTILQVCKILKFNDFDLISPLSESIRLCILKLSRDSGEHDVSGLAGAGIRPIIFAICKLFNDLGIMYDPLFLAISDIIHKEISVLNWDEINLLLSTYSNQKYNDVEIIGQIIKKISEDNLEGLSPNLAISLYSSLLFLECLSSAVKLKLEDRFIIRESDAIRFNEDLDITQLANIAYSNLLLNFLTSEDLNLITSSLSRTAELLGKSKGRDYDKKYSRQLTIIVSFLKCLYPNYYNTLSGSYL
ncbi:hypothetical protein BEWA_030820 [Theileria equi strain WA]|uniref:Uncharacterized protein n=1 Tax=Theileria equi strain WA TaxID=1537102 RepID=L0AZ94_THEEQ|nr:hypothetical protein BEWA_030820 [Theileria equi strain WA]AFZ80229.1 hypothetical protein BEWA_030820 [Theileria equi strain WA]|eukprot:XP_004829895.1 hypothetical protein BEWA_030820 [Theileria equi strain WA]